MKTALYDRHVALGAKMVSFAGWEMPIQYQGIIAEHRAVREDVGLFDLSHMGRIAVEGEGAIPLIDFLSTNQMQGKKDGSATYTVWCDEKGMSIDDLIVYQIDPSHLFVVANAANRVKDLAHIQTQADKQYTVNIDSAYEREGILALQGPQAGPLLSTFIPEAGALKPMHFIYLPNEEIYISRTGYTGAGGYELFGPADRMVTWWDLLLDKGRKWKIQPIGLGARDLLRLEMGFALYGHELSEEIAPTESVSAWTVKMDKPAFLGKDALKEIEKNGKKRFAYGLASLDKGIARQGCEVFLRDEAIGVVTSGTYSPTLGRSISLILVRTPLRQGEEVIVKVRQTFHHAQVVELPFVRKKI